MDPMPFKPLVRLPPDLTIHYPGDAFTGDGRAWCQRKSAQVLGEQARRGDVTRLARCLEDQLEVFRKEMPLITAALCFYPDYATLPPRALVRVHAFGPGKDNRPLTIDRVREIYGTSRATVGETELTEHEVAAGHAVRVHRHSKVQPGKRHSKIFEEVAWVIWPPDFPVAVTLSARWLEPVFAKAGGIIADNMARDFRIAPLGS
jgi:hypothetical protein